MYYSLRVLLTVTGLAVIAGLPLQDAFSRAGETKSAAVPPTREMMVHVVDGLKAAEKAQYLYERIERVETRKLASDADPLSVKVSRVIPAGTSMAKISLGPNGKPTDLEAYRAELDKVLKALSWAVESGQNQREAYQKIQKKEKEREELIDATRNAFVLTFISQETRGDRTLSKYRMEPNPAYKPTSRTTSIFTKVKGVFWVDDAAQQMARVEGEVTEDISLGLFLAKIYKGSRFMQERHEVSPGIWMPSYSQWDFDGRKFFSSFSVHEKTFYTDYKRIGAPAEAIPQIQSELARLDERKLKSSEGHQ